jgi:hypothetical protein
MTDNKVSRREFIVSSGRTVLAAAAVGMFAGASLAATEPRKGKLVAACGIYCGSCPVMVGDEGGDKGKKASKCTGCANKKNPCAILKCAKKNNVEVCSLCKKYPCTEIKSFHANGKPYKIMAAHNLDVIKELGLAKWLQEQDIRWRCTKCSKPVAWDAKMCRKCGTALKTIDDDVLAMNQGKV